MCLLVVIDNVNLARKRNNKANICTLNFRAHYVKHSELICTINLSNQNFSSGGDASRLAKTRFEWLVFPY